MRSGPSLPRKIAPSSARTARQRCARSPAAASRPRPCAVAGARCLEQQFLAASSPSAARTCPDLALLHQRHAHRLRLAAAGSRELDAERSPRTARADSVSEVRQAVGQAERIDLVAAIEDRVGQPGAAEEHAEHRPRARRRRPTARSARARRCAAPCRRATSSSTRSSATIGSPSAPRSSAMRLVLPLGSTATGGGSPPKWSP